MKCKKTAWTTVLSAVGCTVIASLSLASAAAADIGKISPRYYCACELEYKNSSSYNGGPDLQVADESKSGGCDYQQKYASIHSACEAETACDAGIDGTLAAAPAVKVEENETYIFQYEEVKEESNGYEYALPQDMYGSSVMPSLDILKVEDITAEPSWCDVNRYLDEKYSGSPYTAECPPELQGEEDPGFCATLRMTVESRVEFQEEEGPALFTWDPQELLTFSDQELLRVLAIVGDRPWGVRRAVFCDYVESLATAATDLSNRLQKASGLDVPSLADDVSQAAAFIACFRLVERGELELDEASALLQTSLSHRSQRWNLWIGEVTGCEEMIVQEEEKPSGDAAATNGGNESGHDDAKTTANPMLKAVAITAAGSLERLGGAICDISRRIKNLY